MSVSLQQIGNEILHRVRSSVSNPLEPTYDDFSLEELYKKNDEDISQHVTAAIRVHDVRKACLEARDEIQTRRGLSYPNSSWKMAVIRFGVGLCDEMSHYAHAIACAKRVKAFILQAFHPHNEQKGHEFVILGAHGHELAKLDQQCGENLIDAMKLMTEGIILDPYLDLVCRVTEFSGSVLENYLSRNGITYLKAWADSKEGSPEEAERADQAMNEEADLVFERAKQILAQSSWKRNEKSQTLVHFLTDKKRSEFSKVFPKVQWKKNGVKGCVWAEGPLEEIQPVCSHFGVNPKKKQGGNDVYLALLGLDDFKKSQTEKKSED
jgi:hypothetical protein